jgi:hypothetical protein
MSTLLRFAFLCVGIAALFLGEASAQPGAAAQDPAKPPPLTLRTRIPLPGVFGRIDHFGWDGKRANLIVSALGNDTVEIVNSWKRVHSIAGLEHPQASVYVPGIDRIAVSSQSGKLRFYDAQTFAHVKTLDFGADGERTTCDTTLLRSTCISAMAVVGAAPSPSSIRWQWNACRSSRSAAIQNHFSWS